jgi:LmbE family N-acetylglucosaminyl deacetylase
MIDESRLVPYHASPLPYAKGPWLVFAPHADDESFGMGGSIALATAAGVMVDVVIITDGSLGGGGDDLIAVREREAREAAALLGVSSVVFLKQKDRGLQVASAIVSDIRELIVTRQPAAVFFPGIYEAHPDHRATALLVWQALQSTPGNKAVPVSYEITGQSPVNCLVDITSVMDRKKQVIGVYRSQLGEKNYLDVVLSLNRLRTFTLGPEVAWAEGFYIYSSTELRKTLLGLGQERVALQLMD